MTNTPTPPPGYNLVKGADIKDQLPIKGLLWWRSRHGTWDDSMYQSSGGMCGPDLHDFYAIPIATPLDCPQSLLEAAKKIIEERGKDYGDINQSFNRIAKFWSAYKGVEITPKDVAAMMMLLKISRWVTSDKPDTLLDIVGYAECAEKLNKSE